MGLVLRTINLNQSFWLDEATTALVSMMSVKEMFNNFLPGDFHPPVYYLVTRYWASIFGYSEVALRFPSIIFGIATIFLTFKISKKIFDTKTANIAALLVSTSGLFIFYSQEARMYSLAAFLVSLVIYMFINKKWVPLSLAIGLLGLTDYVSLLILPALWLYLLTNFQKKNILNFIYTHAPLFILFGFWIQTFTKQLLSGFEIADTAWGNLLGPATFKNILLIPVKFIIGRVTFDNKIIYALVMFTVLSCVLYLLWRVKNIGKIIWLWLLVPLLLGIILSLKIPTLGYFRFLFCLPALYILIAKSITSSKYVKSLVFLAVLTNLLFSFQYLLNPRFHREDWRGAVKYIENNKIDDSYVQFVSNSNWEAYRYYYPDAKIRSGVLVSKNSKEIWLMRYVWEIFDPQDSVRDSIENLGYKKQEELNFNGILVFKYQLI